jgi:DNA (cytosine-5)-methyltransferase 1
MNLVEIIALRKQYKISQIKLAEASGFSPATISSWELNKSTPSERELTRLEGTLNSIIRDIDTNVKDIRKKRIKKSRKVDGKIPSTIGSKSEYRELLSTRKTDVTTPYVEQLSQMYAAAKQDKDSSAPKAIALFSGCGGMSLGFAAAGYDLVGHLDIEDSANAIYEMNFDGSDLLGTDITKVSDDELHRWTEKYGRIDVLIGGPPCQGFSLAGKRDPNDLRNQLYKYYVHIVSVIKPKAFVMENVRLLTSMKTPDGSLFIDKIIEGFGQAGYTISKKEVNAYEYGVPQSRERIILVGVRNDINKGSFTFPEPTHAIEPQPNLWSSGEKKVVTFRDATFDLQMLESGEQSSDPLHWAIPHPMHVIEWLKDVPEGQSAHDNEDPNLRPPSGFNTTYKRITWDEPCSTISTNFSMISGCRNVHPTSTRSLTIREAARAQSFPDEFVFSGNWGNVRKAIGNAVPPLLAEAIAEALMEQLFKG